jgi:hypothetical protein
MLLKQQKPDNEMDMSWFLCMNINGAYENNPLCLALMTKRFKYDFTPVVQKHQNFLSFFFILINI